MSYKAVVKTVKNLGNSARVGKWETIVRGHTASNNSKIPAIVIRRIRSERCMVSYMLQCFFDDLEMSAL
jgi:hypothetical protein